MEEEMREYDTKILIMVFLMNGNVAPNTTNCSGNHGVFISFEKALNPQPN